MEWYQPGLVESTVDAAIDRLASAAIGLYATLVVAVSAPADETLFAVVAADRSDVVLAACRIADWHVDRITAGVRAHIG
ncbi:hypothetical protein A5715_02205 [Mycolicibacter heraklionensis]|nr:hypothetical protein A5715_02205 [Mycolicibacter heraklionensis]